MIEFGLDVGQKILSSFENENEYTRKFGLDVTKVTDLYQMSIISSCTTKSII